MLVKESHVNVTSGYLLGDPSEYEPFTEDIGRLFRAMQQEHGRCTGRCYIDKNGQAVPIGWVFVKRDKYTDCQETYLHETWVSLLAAPTEHVAIEHTMNLDTLQEVL